MHENIYSLGLRTRPHRHRKQFNSKKNKILSEFDHCQRIECFNNSRKFKRLNHHIELIRPPPLFQLEPPPNPTEFLALQGNLFSLDTTKISCINNFNINEFNTNNKIPKPLHYNITGSIEDSFFRKINNSKTNLQTNNRNHNFSRDGFIKPTSFPAFFPQTSPISANSVESNNENSLLNFVFLFGISMLTVLFVFIIFYICLTRRKNFFTKKRKNRKSQQSDTSSEQVQSSTMSQSSYSSTNNNVNSLGRNYRNQGQPEQTQHLLAHEPTEFSQFIPNLLAMGTLSHHQQQQLLKQNMNSINPNKVPLSNSFLAYDWLSLPHNNNGPFFNNLQNDNSIKPSYPTMNEKLKQNIKKPSKKSSFSSSDENKVKKKKVNSPKNLISQIDTCGCSTLSTRATNETSSSNSSTSTPSSSTKLTQQDTQHLLPSTNNLQLQNNDNNNHYQKLFVKNNSFRHCENHIQQQYQLKYSTNPTSPYMPNKVALLCNTDSNMPQLIKVLDIKDLNDYVQLMSLDNQNRQLGIDHYENFYTNSSSVNHNKKDSCLFPTPQLDPSTDEVYELIDDMAQFNNFDAQQNLQTGSQASSTLLKRKYPKTNPNYNQSPNT